MDIIRKYKSLKYFIILFIISLKSLKIKINDKNQMFFVKLTVLYNSKLKKNK